MKKSSYRIILVLGLIKFIIQMMGNRNYGFHRDELLHLSVSEHLDWGYWEFPPFIALVGKLAHGLFGYSLLGVRFSPTLAGVGILILCALIVKEMGGKSSAIFLSGMSILAFLPFYRNHTLFQPVAFDQFFWTLGFYFLVRFINLEDKKDLLFLGLTLGIGIMNKYTMLVWGFGIFVGIFFYNRASLFKNKWLYISAFLALLICIPNIIWQIQHSYPILQHLHALKEHQLDQINPLAFGLDQLSYPYTLAISLLGMIGMLFVKLTKYRAVALSALVIFSTMWIMNSKSYYVFAVYPVLFAAGSVMIEKLLSKKTILVYAIGIIITLPIIQYIPYLTPIFPIEKFVDYANYEEKKGRIELTGDYADMFGWDEQIALVDSVYQSLTPMEKDNCVLWGGNYGEAGALKILGGKYNFRNPICRHGSFWQWGFDNANADVWISLGIDEGLVEYVFEEHELIKTMHNRYTGEEYGAPIYLCRKPKIDIKAWWAELEEYIFE